MDIRPIKTEADHAAALMRIETLMDAEANTPDGDELDVLTTLVEAYEEKHVPISPSDPLLNGPVPTKATPSSPMRPTT